MVNAVPAEDSSSVSVKHTIVNTEYTSSGILKITLSEGVYLICRTIYFLKPFTISALPFRISEQQLEVLYKAVRCYLAEQEALRYLNRAEHSRFQLQNKLIKKDFLPEEYAPALSYLAQKGLQDDLRYAQAWLHTRSIFKNEGRCRLTAELLKRGISVSIANTALSDFFAQNDELSLCLKAYRKCYKKNYDMQQTVRALQRKGFSFSMIKSCKAYHFSNQE